MPVRAPVAAGPKRTMMGLPNVVETALSPREAADRASAKKKRTFLGMPAAAPDAASDSAHRDVPAEAAVTSAPTAPRSRNATMMGMPAVSPVVVTPATPERSTSETPAPTARARASLGPTNRTMLGLPTVAAPEPAVAAVPSPAEAVATPVTPSPSTEPIAPVSTSAAASAGWTAAPDPVPPPDSARAPAVFSTPSRPRAQVSYDVAPPAASTSSTRKLVSISIGLLGLGLAAALAAAGAYWISQRGVAVRASIAHDAEGELLVLHVPEAPPGTFARFAGEERPVENGRVHFSVAADDLRIGDNHLAIDLVAGDGTLRKTTVTLTLDYRIRPTLEGLANEPAFLGIVVDAKPGLQAFVDEKPVPLDGDGHGSVSVPVALAAGEAALPVIEKDVRYRIVGAEHGGQGVLKLRIPVTSLQIDRPGKELVTEASAIEIAGAVHPEASVEIDGARVKVEEGRFVHRVPLEGVGEHRPAIVVRQAGRAPRRKELRIRRVESIAAEAARFEVDAQLTYARLEQNPEIYRGRNLAFEGRVYNVEVSGGRSILQLLVKNCPTGKRCPLWVTYPAATDTIAQSWVRVLGKAAGEQQFRSESGRIIAVPRVDAEFVLPSSVRNP